MIIYLALQQAVVSLQAIDNFRERIEFGKQFLGLVGDLFQRLEGSLALAPGHGMGHLLAAAGVIGRNLV